MKNLSSEANVLSLELVSTVSRESIVDVSLNVTGFPTKLEGGSVTDFTFSAENESTESVSFFLTGEDDGNSFVPSEGTLERGKNSVSIQFTAPLEEGTYSFTLVIQKGDVVEFEEVFEIMVYEKRILNIQESSDSQSMEREDEDDGEETKNGGQTSPQDTDTDKGSQPESETRIQRVPVGQWHSLKHA